MPETATEWAAWMGAFGALGLVIFEIFKWGRISRPQLRVTQSPIVATERNGEFRPGPYVAVTVVNTGAMTKITQFGVWTYKSRWERLMRKHTGTLLCPSEGLPYELKTGDNWIGFLLHQHYFFENSRKGLLYAGIWHTMAKKPLRIKLDVPELDTTTPKWLESRTATAKEVARLFIPVVEQNG